MWIQHDLSIDLADTEIAEPSRTMGLAGGEDVQRVPDPGCWRLASLPVTL